MWEYCVCAYAYGRSVIGLICLSTGNTLGVPGQLVSSITHHCRRLFKMSSSRPEAKGDRARRGMLVHIADHTTGKGHLSAYRLCPSLYREDKRH